jgi:hypothetical protein
MTTNELMQSLRVLVDRDGKPSAVQLSIEAWEALIDWLEDVEDREAIRVLLPRLRLEPLQAGALPWSEVRRDW